MIDHATETIQATVGISQRYVGFSVRRLHRFQRSVPLAVCASGNFRTLLSAFSLNINVAKFILYDKVFSFSRLGPRFRNFQGHPKPLDNHTVTFLNAKWPFSDSTIYFFWLRSPKDSEQAYRKHKSYNENGEREQRSNNYYEPSKGICPTEHCFIMTIND